MINPLLIGLAIGGTLVGLAVIERFMRPKALPPVKDISHKRMVYEEQMREEHRSVGRFMVPRGIHGEDYMEYQNRHK